jgi:NTE family protein
MGSLRTWLEDAVGRIREFAYAQPDRLQLGSQRPRIGLALGGGFARGIAHLGVFKVFQENNIPIDCLAGTSVGALVAAAFASGVPLDKMERQAAMTHFRDFARWTVSWMGLATNERLEGYLRRFAPVSRFDELKIPLTIVATDLRRGEPVYFTEGLVGGFLVAPVPVDAVRRMGAEFVIAVHLEGGGDAPLKSVTDVIGRSFSIAQRSAQQQWRGQADVVIEPAVKSFLWDDFEKSPEMIAAGAAAARAALPRIRAALAQPQEVSTVRSPAYR